MCFFKSVVTTPNRRRPRGKLAPAQQALVVDHLDYVRRLLRTRFSGYARVLGADEAEGVAVVELCRQALTFRPGTVGRHTGQAVKFSSWAYLSVRAALRQAARKVLREMPTDFSVVEPRSRELSPLWQAVVNETPPAEADTGPRPGTAFLYTPEGRAYLEQAYVREEQSTFSIAKARGTFPATIAKALKFHGFVLRDKKLARQLAVRHGRIVRRPTRRRTQAVPAG